MAKARNQGRVRLVGVARRTRSALMVSTALQAVVVMVLTVPAGAQPAPNARPMGGVVVGGAVAINQNAASTNINQSTQRGAINWQSFDVGAQQSVNFQQPNAKAITLNTVTGPNPSQIAGKINANGQIVLVNQSGVTFYKGSQVNTAGLMVSASKTDPAAFMRGGKIVFDQPGNANAQIVNNGNITISGAGLAGLVAPEVANAGVINAKLGHVVLASGTAATLDLYGDKLVSLNVTGAVTQAPGGGEALVTNTGVIRADGGTVQLTARAVDGVVTNLVNAGGKIQANTVGAHQGRITIDGVGGSITITGNLEAAGKAPGTVGGKIGLLASDSVIVKSGAIVNASGAAGGGTIAIGTTLKRAAGGPAVTGAKMAKGVLVEQGASISAGATGNGDGGHVTVLSSLLTAMDGSISATGGPTGGNGGIVEVSGGVLSLTGAVNLAAPVGRKGSLLLDPTDLDIVDTVAAGSNIDSEFASGKLAFGAADAGTTPSTITAAKINTLGATGNVTIQASGSIDFQNTVTPILIGNDLTAQAGGNLLVDRGVSITTTGANLSLTSGADAGGLAANTGSIALGATGVSVAAASLSAKALVLNAGSTGINLKDASITVTNLANLNALGGGVTQTAAGVLSAGTLASSGGITGTVNLAGTANTVASIGSVAVTSGDFTLVNTGKLAVTGNLTAGNVSLASDTITAASSIGAGTLLALSAGAGGIALNTGHILTGATVDLSSGGGVSQISTGTIAASTILQSSSGVTGAVSLGGTNTVAATGKFLVSGGGFTLNDTSTLSVGNTLSATAVSLTAPSILIPGKLTDGGAGTVALFANTGSISETGTIVAGTLSGSAVAAVNLSGASATANSIANLGSLKGASLTLRNNPNLLIANNVSMTGSISLTDVGSITIKAGQTLAGTAIALSGGGIVIDGVLTDGGSGTVSLISTADNGIDESAGTIIAGTLSGSVGNNGIANLSGNSATANQIANLGSFTGGTGSGLTLVDGSALTVTGSVSVANAVSLASGGLLTVNAGQTISAGSVTLSGTGVAISGLVTATGTVDLIASSSSITESGTIDALTLIGSSAASAILSGASAAANQITNLGTFTAATGSIVVNDGTVLNVTDIVTATKGDIVLNAAGVGNTVSIAAGGSLIAVSTGTASVRADVLTINATGTITGGTFEYAQDTTGALTLGAGGAIVNLTNIGATNLRFGSARGSITASSITIASSFGTSTANLELDSTGAITQSAGAVLTALTLTGTAGGAVGLGSLANVVSNLGSFNAGANTFALNDSGLAGDLGISGPVTGSAVSITGAPTITVTGSIGATAGLTLSAGAGGILLNSGEILSGTTVDLTSGGGVTQVAAGIINAGTLLSSGGVTAGTVTLAGTANSIAALGSVVLTNGDFDLVDNGNTANLTISGLISAKNISIADANTGTISVGGSLSAGTSLVLSSGSGGIQLNAGDVLIGATVDLSTLDGGITQVSGGTISASAILRSASGVTGSVNLAGTANDIVSVGAFAVTKGDFTLVDNGNTGNLTLAGPLTAGNVTVSDANTGTISVSGSVGATTALTLSSGSGGIQLNSGVILSGATVDLSTTGGGVTEFSTGTISATSILQSTSNVVGTVSLASSGNTIAAIGNLTVTSGDIVISDPGVTGTETISGTVVANNVTLLAANGTLSIGGSIHAAAAGGTVALSTGGGITLTTTGTVDAPVVDVSGTGATGLVELGNSVLRASTDLQSTGNIGLVQLGGLNTIAAIGVAGGVGFQVTGGFQLQDTEALTIAGVLKSGGGIFIQEPSATALSIGALGALTLTSPGTIGLWTDQLSVTSGGKVDATSTGVVEIAPVTNTVSVSLGATTPGDLTLDATALAAINTGLLRIGQLHNPFAANAVTTTAAGITIAAVASLAAANVPVLELDTTGGITQGAGAILTTQSLTGTAAAAGVTLGEQNAVSNLGNFTVTGGAFTLVDSVDLAVPGVLNAGGPVALTGKSISIAGSITTGGSTTSSVTLVAKSTTIGGAGSITTGTLTATAPGAISLTGGNLISNVGSLSGTAINLNDGAALTILNGVTGTGAVTLTSGGLLTLNSGQSISGTGVTLSGTSLAISGQVTSAGTVDLIATAATGGITESGTIDALTLIGSVGASAILSGASVAANQITNLGSFTATTGTILLNDGLALNVSGIVSATSGDVILRSTGLLGVDLLTTGALASAPSTGTVSVRANAFSVAGAGTVTGGIFEYALDTPGVLNVGLLGEIVDLTGVGSSLVRLGSAQGSITAQGLTLTSNLDLGLGNGNAARALDLESTLGIDEGLFELQHVTTLSGAATGGSVALGNANTVAALGSFAVTGGFTFQTVDDLTIANVLSAASISLTAPNIAISGTITTGGSTVSQTALVANVGTIAETGAGQIVTGVLSGSAVGTVTLLGSNQVGTLGLFPSAAFALNDVPALTISNNVSAAGAVTLTSSGLLTINATETVAGSSVSLQGSSIAISGEVTDGGAGTVNLNATGGTITEPGTIVAGTLSSQSAFATDLSGALANTNQIANLGTFIASVGSITVRDGLGAGLSILNNVSASGSISVTSTGPIAFASGKTMTGGGETLQGTAITVSGEITDGGAGTVNLFATTGTVSEPGTLIAGTVNATGSAIDLSGATAGANQIVNLGSVTTAGSLTVRDGATALTIANTVSAGGTVSLTSAGLLTVNSSQSLTGAAVSLSGTALAINGLVTDGGAGSVTLVATGGTIGETGTLIAGTLTGSSTGVTSLIGAAAGANQVATLGSFTASGFTLNDGMPLNVAGTVTATAANGVTILDTGSMAVSGKISSPLGNIVLGAAVGALRINGGTVIASGHTVSVAADSLVFAGGGITAATFEYGPGTVGGTVTLGGGGFTTSGITATSIRIGQVNGTTDAGAIIVAGYDNANQPLELDATGAVTQTGSLTGVSILTGTAGSFTLTNTANAIAQFGGGTLAGGTLSTTGGGALRLFDNEAATLAGLVSAGTTGTVDISTTAGKGFGLTQAATETLVAGVLTSTSGISGAVNLQGTVNTIGTISGLTAAGLTVVDNQALTLAGTVGVGSSGTVDLTTTAGKNFSVAQAGSGVLTAGFGTSKGGISGTLILQGASNAIGTITGVTASGLTVVDNQALTLAGVVSVGAGGTVDVSTTAGKGFGVAQAATATLTAGVLTSATGVSGQLSLQGTANAIGTITAVSAAGLTVVDNQALVLAGAISVGASGTVDLSTTAGKGFAVSQSGSGVLTAGLLTSASGVSGAVILQGTSNAVGTIGGLTAGGLTVVDNQALTLAGTVSVGAAGTVDLSTTAGKGFGVAQASTGILTAGVLTSASGVSGAVTLQGTTNAIGAISGLTATGLTAVDNQALTLAGVISVGNSGTVDLTTTAGKGFGVTQGGAATLTAGVLTSAGSISGAASLGGTANAIGTITALTANGLTVVDSAALTLAGAVSGGAAGTVDISTNSGANLMQAAAATLTAGVLTSASGIAGTAILQGTSNAIGTLSGFTATGSLAVVDGKAMTVAGAVGASGGNVYLTTGTNALTFASGGSVASVAGGRIGLQADSVVNLGTTGATGLVNAGTAGVFEFAPGSAATITLGAASGLSLTNTTGITAGELVIGAVTLPSGATPTITGAAITVAGTFDAGGRALELDAAGAVNQAAPLLNVTRLSGQAASYTLINPANTIGQLAGAIGAFPTAALSATGGTIAVIDNAALTIGGSVSATAGNVFLSSGTNALTFGSGGTVISRAAGTIGLQAGSLVNLGTAGATGVVDSNGGVVELAPGGTTATLTLGTNTPGALSLTDTTGIVATPFLRLGAVTLPGGGSPTTTAAAINIGGTFNPASANVELDSTGAVTQAPTAAVNIGTLTGTALGYTLTAAKNNIIQVGGGTLTATGPAGGGGTIAIIDNNSLIIAGTVQATQGSVFLSVSAGNTITFFGAAPTLAAPLGRVGLQADTLVNIASNGATGVINAGTGIFEFAPSNTLLPITLGASSGPSLVNMTGITAGTLRLGAVTLPGSASPITTAASIVVLGTFNATGANLELDAIGGVTQNTGASLLNVGTLTGTASSYTLTTSGNTIGQVGGGTLIATTGTIAIIDSTSLTVAGTVQATAGNVFLQTTAGHAITFASAGTLRSVAGGTIGIEADSVVNLGTTGATGVVNAGSTGIFELAPTTTLATETLGAASGLSLTNLTNITAGMLRIGAVTQPGSASPTVTAGSIAVAGTFNAATIGTLDLEAKGTISQLATAPIVNLASLLASTNGVAGDINLGSTLNSIGTIGNIDVTLGNFVFGDTPLSGSFLVSSGQTIVANNVTMTVLGTLNVNGAITVAATGVPGNVTLAAVGATSDLNIGTGAAIDANATASLSAGQNLTQSGGVINAGTVTEVAGGLLTAGASVSATAISLSGTSISITGLVTDGGSGTVSLTATTGTINDTGTLIAGTLSGSSKGATTLTGATVTTNQVAAIGTFTAAGFSLNDGVTLTVAGVLNGGTAATIVDSALLTVGGTVSATAVSLTGANIAISGLVTDGGGGTTSLIATTGTINETGTLLAGTLTGSSKGATALSGATTTINQVATLGGFTAAGFSLNNGSTLTVSGVLNGGSSAAIVDSALLTVSGSVSATAISLTGANIDISGLVTDGGAGTVGLVATTGTIAEGGTLIAGTLSGSSKGATTLSGATPTTNQVTTLGTFTAAGFSLNDGAILTVTGAVSGGTAATIVDSASLTVSGTVSAAAVSLTGANLTIGGLVTDGGVGTVSLIATTGSINETGTLIAGTLSGSSKGATTLSGATTTINQVTTLGTFTAAGFSLNDGATLTVAGVLNGGTAATIVDSALLTVGGTVSATAVSLTGANITITGLVTDGGSGTVGLIATTGTINETGTLIAGTLSGSSKGATALSGTKATTNQVATIGTFTAAGFSLNDGATLTVSGLLNGGTSAAIVDSALLTVGGTVTAAAVSLTAANIAIPGLVTDGGTGTTSLTATAGTIDEGGTLIAGSLSGSSTGATTLTGTNPTINQVAAIGTFTAAGFSLNDGVTLTVAGVLNGGTAATIVDSALLTVGGSVSATAVSLTGANIAISGLVTDGGTGTTSLIATAGTINETGTLIAGTLTGSSTGATALSGATTTINQIATLGAFTAAGFSLNDGETLAVSGVLNGGTAATIVDSTTLTIGGTVTATAISLTGANIGISGLVTDGGAGTVSLIATTGTIAEGGTLIAGTLSGSSKGATTLSGATTTINQVATLGGFTAAGFSLNDGAILTVTGVVSGGTAATIVDSTSLTVGGTVSAAAVSLTGANLTIGGLVTDGGTGTTSLIATAGTIGEAGTLIAGTLTGSSTGATTLSGATTTVNQVATLGAFTAAGFSLNDGETLAVSGVLNGGTAATIVDSTTLTIGGTVTAAAISLTGANIGISGLVTDGGSGTVSLIATTGTIAEGGTLIAGTLSGSSKGATTLSGATTTINQVATLGGFTAAGFSLNDGAILTVSGVVNGGTSAAIVDSTSLTVGGTVSAAAVSLTGANLTIGGLVTDGGTGGTTSLIATTGTIGESGTLIAGTLSGSSKGATSLTGATPTTNQVATISTFTAAGFSLNDGATLTVSGVLNGGTAATIVDSAAVTIGGTASAAAVSLTAANITISGLLTDGGAGTTALIATVGTINETGTLIAGTLSGNSTGATTLIGATTTTNQIATLSSFTASGLTLNNGSNLAITGAIAAGGTFALTETGNLNIGSAASISAGGVQIGDTGNGTILGTVASTGTASITTSGTLGISGTLSATNGGTAVSGGDMTVSGTLISSAGTIGITDTGSLTVSGLVSAQTGVTIGDTGTMVVGGGVLSTTGTAAVTVTGPLTISGTVAAPAIAMSAANLTIGGLVTDGGAGTVSLIATTGTIGESGTLIAGTLSGSSKASTSLTGATPTTNQVATVSTFTAAGFSLNDGAALTVSGVLNGGTAAAILDSAALTVGGTVTATAISMTGANLTIGGDVTDGGSGTVSLIATAGTINETGTLIAGTLSGNSTGATTLSGATTITNQVSTVGTFTAAGFSLNDGENLTIAGVLNGGTAATIVDSALMNVVGTVGATAISLTAANIAIPGLVTDGGSGTVSLIATAGTINELGTLIAGTLSGSSTGATTLIDAPSFANQVAILGNFTAAGFTLIDGRSLTVTGLVNGGSAVTITDAVQVSVTGTITATAVSLTSPSIAISGLLTDGGAGTVSLIANGGGITETGTLIAGTLSGSSSGATSLTGATATANQITALTNFAAANFILNNGHNLGITGTLSSASGPIAITEAGTLIVLGLISGQSGVTIIDSGPMVVSGSIVSPAGTIGISDNGALTIGGGLNGQTGVTIVETGPMAVSGGIVTLGGTIGINDTGTMTVPGVINGQNGVTIVNSGGMTVAGNILSPGGTIGVNDTGALSVPGQINGQSGVTIADTGAMTVAGTIISAGSVSISDTGTMTVTGTINGASGVTQSASGDMILSGLFRSGSGAVSLTDIGALTLSSSNAIIAASITIADHNTMQLGGLLEAPRIVVDNGTGSATILANTTIETAGSARPTGAIAFNNLPVSTNPTDQGFYMTTGALVQSGDLTITAITPGNPSTARFDTSGTIAFANAPDGVLAPNSWLILALASGAKSSGNVDVLHLDAVFPPGASASTALTGQVNGLNGNAAAGAADIAPGTNATFQINGCPIGSINCVLLTTQGIPTASPLNNFVIGSIFNPTDEDDLLLPLVSDEVY
jgi:filamentous hemagglutinin family protein